MKNSLAEALLGQVMGWDGTDMATSNTLLSLQMLASHKYDDYQRFRPGRKFIESLAIWLRQFRTVDERRTALAFVQRQLIFISNDEMEQLVEILYPKVIRPILRDYVSKKLGIPKYAIHKIENNLEFARARRLSLFLGLSDGARMDEFRRSNRDLSTEQVYATYEVSEPRLVEMRSQLLEEHEQGETDPSRFDLVFLIDDFAGSGKTILREKDGDYEGRLKKFSDLLSSDSAAGSSVFSGPDTEIHICLYVATRQAVEHFLTRLSKTTLEWQRGLTLPRSTSFNSLMKATGSSRRNEPEFCGLLDDYYDKEIEDEAKQVGGSSSKFGFAECALPLVLSHNTPNNSVSLLWAPLPMQALFPRFERHTRRKA